MVMVRVNQRLRFFPSGGVDPMECLPRPDCIWLIGCCLRFGGALCVASGGLLPQCASLQVWICEKTGAMPGVLPSIEGSPLFVFLLGLLDVSYLAGR